MWLLLILKKQYKKCVALIVLLTIVCSVHTEQVAEAEHGKTQILQTVQTTETSLSLTN